MPIVKMNIPVLMEEDIRRIFREEFKRFITSTPSAGTHTEEEDELIGTAEAARLLGCSTRTIATFRSRGLWQVVMRGPKKAMYYKSEILAFRAANTRPCRNTK